MATEVILPKFGFTLEESTIVEWLVGEGDVVEQSDPLCEVTTDKVNMEVEAPASGIVGGIAYQAGEVVPVTAVIAYILAEGEAVPEPKVAKPAPAAQTESESTAPQPTESQPEGGAVSITPLARRLAAEQGVDLAGLTGSGANGKIVREDVERALTADDGAEAGKVRATPAARRVARERGLDLGQIGGSGPRGRLQEADVLAVAAQPMQPAPVASSQTVEVGEGVQVIPLEGMRKTIAARLQASYQTAPHITFTVDVDMGEAIALKDRASESAGDGAGVSMTAILLKACAWALRQHPMVNSHLVDDRILVQPEVNVGMAVALDEGLIVPVIHGVDRKGLVELGAEVRDLATRARGNKLRASDLTGGTFTVSNMGMFGVRQFTAIINPPEIAILAVGETAARFVPDEDGQPVARPIMTITLSADHRVIDGALAGRFIVAVKQALEEPTLILL
jgi:pyruvate dehydrogenase E2 component (dihydrolipoamide acetyltransferase)